MHINWRVANLVSITSCAVALGCGASATESVATNESAVTLNTVTRESLDNQGRQGNGASTTPFISGNQRYVVFQSNANVWAANDTNGTTDIYLKDRQTGSITLVSQANGVVGNGASFNPSVSDDGRVAFASNATNLAPNASGPFTAILARDTNGIIHRVDVNAQAQVANGPSTRPQISGDGFSVIFQSDATNLVPDDTNGATDVFVGGSAGCCGLDRVSHPTFSSQANGASFDGSIGFDARFVAFASDATNLVFNDTNGVTDVFGRDRRGGGPTVALSFTLNPTFTMGNGASTMPQISSDGHWVSFRSLATNFDPTDTNGVADIYLAAIGSGSGPTRVSLSSGGAQANGTSFQSTVATNGKAVAFVSSATNLVGNDTNGFPDVFVHDQTTGQTIRVQRDASTQPNGSPLVNSSMRFSGNPTSPGFSFLAFDSQATNMVFSDSNQVADVFTASLSP